MEKGQHSQTAAATALFRAAHQVLDDEPKVLDDPLAEKILGPQDAAAIRNEAEKYARPYLVRARTLAVMRSRFVEDELAAAIERGIRQYVILGAGLDTSPYRQPAADARLVIFEVDHPDTQDWKLAKLRDAHIAIPPNVQHVTVDFETESLADELEAAGFDHDRAAFYSWLGVTYYLGHDAFVDTLRYIAAGTRGSEVIFDFGLADSELSSREREAFETFSEYLQKNNEPWLSRFSPRELQNDLHKIGFNDIFYLSRELATDRYLKNRGDGLNLDGVIQMMSATV